MKFFNQIYISSKNKNFNFWPKYQRHEKIIRKLFCSKFDALQKKDIYHFIIPRILKPEFLF